MQQPHDLVRTFLSAIRDECGASTASVFIPTWPGVDEAILVHSDTEPAVPELHDVARACSFAAGQNRAEPVTSNDGSVTIASERSGGTLLPIPLVASLWHSQIPTSHSGQGPPTPGRRATDAVASPTSAGWVGLRFASCDGAAAATPSAEARSLAVSQSALTLAARLASLYLLLYDSLADPLTELPGRSVLRAALRRELGVARPDRAPLSLVFFNPDDFAQVNAVHRRSVGDQVLREVVSRAQTALRGTDLLCRHGAAIFAVMLGDTGSEAAALVADKLRVALGASPYLDGQIALKFSAGIATFAADEAAPGDPVDFIGRAEAALAMAKGAGGDRVCAWRAGTNESPEPLDRLRHAFSGDQDRDYRNMGLLWDAVGLLATSGSSRDLAERVVSQLRRTLAASLVALFEPGDGGLQFRCGLTCPPGAGAREAQASEALLTADERRAVSSAADTRVPIWQAGDAGAAQSSVSCAVPLVVDGDLVGVLLLTGGPEHMKFDESDLPFVKGLAGPLGLALERARNAERRRQQDDLERQRLVGELKGLRTAVRQARLVYVSRQMDDLVVTAHRVADTDATILITGESGTGKEMLAQTIHQMSNRRGRPLVTVDCGAIPATLIESELFGHERGAFTGAMTKSIGRLGQADGGTVLLDEIGELPLEVQSKLLRFVQEKQFTAVGSSVVRRVDVRVLAATNRDLADEVARGRFRGDLYHRLNVIPLTIPALRRRPEDIPELARHFLQVFAAKYQKPVRQLGAEVEAALVGHAWPGNIRELQNRIMRAVIMSSGDTLTLDALSLPQGRRVCAQGRTPLEAADGGGDPAPDRAEDDPTHGPNGLEVPTFLPHDRPTALPADATAAWAELRTVLTTVVASVCAEPGAVYPPLGRWMGNDLVLAAFDTGGRVARRGSALLGLPETTFMRRLHRAQSEAALVRRPAEWEPVTRAAARLLRTPLPHGEDVLGTAEAYLLDAITQRLGHNAAAGASLLGTSLPTFRRRLSALQVAS